MKTSIWSKNEPMPDLKPGMVVEIMTVGGALSVFAYVQTEQGMFWVGLYSQIMSDQKALAFYTSATIPGDRHIVHTVWDNIADYFKERGFEAMNKVM